jgi:hypothetical protein
MGRARGGAEGQPAKTTQPAPNCPWQSIQHLQQHPHRQQRVTIRTSVDRADVVRPMVRFSRFVK